MEALTAVVLRSTQDNHAMDHVKTVNYVQLVSVTFIKYY